MSYLPQRRVSRRKQGTLILANLLIVRVGLCLDSICLIWCDETLNDNASVSAYHADNFFDGGRSWQRRDFRVVSLMGRVRHFVKRLNKVRKKKA